LNKIFHLPSITGFGVSSAFAVTQGWSLPEFCWSTWLAGLIYSWMCVFTAVIQIVLTASPDKKIYENRLPIFQSVSANIFSLVIFLIVIIAGYVAFWIYAYLFGFYGLFLSFFSEMEPHFLFGRNGFINSDFFTPVIHLLILFWPMVLGTLIAKAEDFLRNNPWKRMLFPFHSEIIRIHVFIICLPFITLIAWALFGESYQPITIVVLMGLFYLFPRKEKDDEPENEKEFQ
jgi:hypothetical protein